MSPYRPAARFHVHFFAPGGVSESSSHMDFFLSISIVSNFFVAALIWSVNLELCKQIPCKVQSTKVIITILKDPKSKNAFITIYPEFHPVPR